VEAVSKAVTGIYTPLIGRFGNKLFQWAHAKALSEQEGVELITPPWEGNFIFGIPESRKRQAGDVEVGEYRQQQKDLIYTRQQVREWLCVRKELLDATEFIWGNQPEVMAHRRVGDYIGYGYPVVSAESYEKAIFGRGYEAFGVVSDESPRTCAGMSGDLAFIPDFISLLKAKILFRGNSTFSWWAATLGDSLVYSPVVDGLEGGKEHDVEFVLGNHPKFCNLPCVTDLYLKE
jgi:hypothetical protein